jgi:hypothetical protein
MGGDYGPLDLPSIEELAGFEPAPDRTPGELQVAILHSMGEADRPPRIRHADAPDVSGLREELGL